MDTEVPFASLAAGFFPGRVGISSHLDPMGLDSADLIPEARLERVTNIDNAHHYYPLLLSLSPIYRVRPGGQILLSRESCGSRWFVPHSVIFRTTSCIFSHTLLSVKRNLKRVGRFKSGAELALIVLPPMVRHHMARFQNSRLRYPPLGRLGDRQSGLRRAIETRGSPLNFDTTTLLRRVHWVSG